MEDVFGMDSQALQELHRQREYMDCVPFNTPMKKLVDAFKAVERGRVQEAEGVANVWLVQGSKGDPYRVTTQGCSCPNGQHTHKTRFNCYHAVAAELYQRWQRAMQPSLTLPLPPITIDERLAQPTPQETPMAAPRDDEYIPEPETADAATAPRVVMPTVVSQEAPVAALVRLPETTLAAVALEASLEEWGKQRAVITQHIKRHFIEGVDYYTLKIGSRETKPTLGKAGSEKFLGLFQLQASFRKDQDTWEMLGCPVGVICYVCTLHTRSGEVVGEGRGARDIKKDGGDVNKALKMCEKSSMIDAILRTGALSDAFTQDRDPEDMLPDHPEAGHVPKLPTDLKQKYDRRAFQEEYGYSTNAHYDTGGLREAVLQRDGFACVLCGMTDAEHKAKWQRPITVDHMDKNRSNNTMENLQTLCLSCHGRKDILPELTEQQVVKFKDEVLKRREAGEGYAKIADDLGFSIASIWKWHRRWTGITDAPAVAAPTLDDDRKAIAYYLRKLYGMGGASKEAYETAVLKATGLRLVPEHYREIERKLRALMDEAEAALASR